MNTDSYINKLTEPYGIEVNTYWTEYDYENHAPADTEGPEDLQTLIDYYDDIQGTWGDQEDKTFCKVRHTINHKTGEESFTIIDWHEWNAFEPERSDFEEHNNLFKASRGV